MNKNSNAVITLKELVSELYIKYKIPNKIDENEMKKIRNKLRSDKGKHLDDISLRKNLKEHWEWPIELKDDIELELMALINN